MSPSLVENERNHDGQEIFVWVLILITKIGSNWQNVVADILHAVWSILCMAVRWMSNDLLDKTISRHSLCLEDLVIDSSKI